MSKYILQPADRKKKMVSPFLIRKPLLLHLKGPVIIYVEGGGGGEKKGGGGVKAISDWLEGGGGLNFFIKKFRGGGGVSSLRYTVL